MTEQSGCPNHKLERSYVTAEMVFWECANCEDGECEHFCDMDDEGWAWLRAHYVDSK